ncbi:MAG: beta-ketoacyl synthase [Sphingobacteriales bacterium]|nr:MAG: beta-ketoacyl synthase [Sphingobacteriales bacterium]
MIPVYAIATNITSALGLDTDMHWRNVAASRSGILCHDDHSLSDTPFFGSRLDPAHWQVVRAQGNTSRPLSPFEEMCLYSAKKARSEYPYDIDPKETLFILSTTKGNIEWLGQMPDSRLLLSTSAQLIAQELGIPHEAVVVSQACVSGVVGLTYGLRMLQSGRYKHAIVTGADRMTKFVLSGFQSFQAVADEPCRPFDAKRKGINLGEAAATIILSVDDKLPMAQLLSGATSNDANHISGPSRTGEELAMAIQRAMKEANVAPPQVDMVSAHGTATLYNDEMEAKAFGICGLDKVPVHSFKGYVGHTLGAAGVLESSMAIAAMRHQQLIPSAGYETSGVSVPLNVTMQMAAHTPINHVLKTASGFGGVNAAAVWRNINASML